MQEELVIGQARERCSNFSPMKMFQKKKNSTLEKWAVYMMCWIFSLSIWVTTKEVNRDAISSNGGKVTRSDKNIGASYEGCVIT